jgi:phosphate transport system substrate-binding protein
VANDRGRTTKTDRPRRWGWLTVGLLVLAGCAQVMVATPAPVNITIVGATAMQPTLFELTAEYSRQHPHVRFDVRGGGSTIGEELVTNGQAQLAASTLLEGDAAVTSRPGSGRLIRTPIGIDGLAIVVHPTNPVLDLTLADLRALYSGRLLDWSEVGGESGEVLLVSREDGSGSRILFERRVMGDEPVSLTAVVMPTSTDVVAYVARNPQAIGYVSRAYVVDALPGATERGEETPASRVRVVAVEGQLPTVSSLREQNYVLTQPLFLISRGEPQGQVRAFIDFVLSPSGQAIVERYHARVR